MADAGQCPKCGEFHLKFEEPEHGTGYLYYPYKCTKCGFEGQEYYNVEFTHHADSNGEPI